MDADRVLVEDIDAVDVFQRAAQKVVADGGVLDTQDVELHRLGVDLPAVVKEHPLAQAEGPGAELLVRLPALGQAGADGAPLIDIGQTVIHLGGGMHDLVPIISMCVETRDIQARTIEQRAAALRMALAGSGRLIAQAERRHASERATSSHQEVTPRELKLPVRL